MVFGNVQLTIPYDLKKGASKSNGVQYEKLDLSNVYDYKLRELTKKELSNIKKNK